MTSPPETKMTQENSSKVRKSLYRASRVEGGVRLRFSEIVSSKFDLHCTIVPIYNSLSMHQ